MIHPKYRPDIDGLRAVAVLSVLGFHAFPQWVKGGFIGVDIFFVISGFLISTIIFGSLQGKGFSYAEFYARRIKRIFPALVVVMAATFAFGWYILLPGEWQQLGKHVAAGAGFVSNFAFWGEAGYFDNAAETKPLLHLWSLAIEEQFYIFWPLLLGLAWKRRWRMLAVIGAVAAASFLLNVSTIHSHRTAAFYSPLSRFWELMAGGMLAYMRLHKPHLLVKQRNLQAIAGFVL
ncbi:MAG: acyltransferase, partial [Comamonadaceae bacterium]